ncbi:hypothetical protein HDU98_006464 [Podochytrium sp. JEL0797]|nr:hypothetical protein HDU98_006464 [Podochytrium sp. JEL0797]
MAKKKKKSGTSPAPGTPSSQTHNEPESLFSFEELEDSPSAFYLNNNNYNNTNNNKNTSNTSTASTTKPLLIDLLGEDNPDVFSRVAARRRKPSVSAGETDDEAFAAPAKPSSLPAAPSHSQDLLGIFDPVMVPVQDSPAANPNDVTLNISHDAGSLSLTVGELISKLDRLDKLQGMFNDLEKSYKKLSKHNVRVNQIVGLYTPLVDGVSAGDDAGLEKLNSWFVDQRTKVSDAAKRNEALSLEVSLLKEDQNVHRAEMEAKEETIRDLERVIEKRDEEIKSLHSNAPPHSTSESPTTYIEPSPAPVPTKRTSRIFTSSPIISSSPTTATSPPPNPTSFFGFGKKTPTTATSPPTASAPEPTDAVTASTFQMKLKIRDLAGALKKVTEQRDRAVQRIKELQQQQQPRSVLQPAVMHMGGMSPGVDDLVAGAAAGGALVSVDLDVGRTSFESTVSSLGFDESGVMMRGGGDSVDLGSRSRGVSPSSGVAKDRGRVKELQHQIEVLEGKVAQLTEVNKSLRVQHQSKKRMSSTRSGSFFDESLGSVDAVEVVGLESQLLETREVVQTLEQQLRNVSVARDEALDQCVELMQRVGKVEAEKAEVQGMLDGVEERNAAAVDGVAAVYDVTVRTLESDLESRKRMWGVEVERREAVEAEVKGLRKIQGDLEESVKGLKEEVERLKACEGEAEKRKEVEARLEEAEKQVVEVTKQLGLVTAEWETAKQSAASQAVSLDSLRVETEAAQTKQKEAVAKMEKAFAVIRKLKTEGETKEASVAKLSSEVESARIELGRVQAELEVVRRKADEVEGENGSRMADLSARVEDLARLNESLEAAAKAVVACDHGDVDALHARIADSASQIETLSARVEDLASHNESVNAELKQLETYQKEVMELNETLSNRVEELTRLNASLELAAKVATCDHEDVDSLHANIADSATQVATLAARVEELTRLNASLESAAKAATCDHGDVDALHTNIADSATQVATLSARVEELTRLNESLASAAEVATCDHGDVDALHSRIADSATQIEILSARVEDLARHNESVNVELKQLETYQKEVTELNETLSNDVEELTRLNASLELAAKATTCDHGDVDALHARIADSASQIETLSTRVEDLVRHNESVNVELKQLETYQKEVMELNSCVEDSTAQIAALQARLQELGVGDGVLAVEPKVGAAPGLDHEAIDVLHEKIGQLEKRLSVASAMDPLSEACTTTNISVLEDTIARLRDQLNSSQPATIASAAVPACDHEDVGLLHSRIGKLEKQLSAVSTAEPLSEACTHTNISVLEDTIARLRDQLEAKSLRDETASRMESLATRVPELTHASPPKCEHESVDALQSRIVELQQQLSIASAASCTHTDVSVLQDTIAHLRKQFEALSLTDASHARELEHVQSELRDAKTKLEALVSVKAELEVQLETSQSAHKEAVAKVDKAYAVVRKMRGDADVRIKELETTKGELDALKSVSASMEVLDQEKAGVEREAEELRRRVGELEEQTRGVSACDHEDVEVLKQTISDLRKQLEVRGAASNEGSGDVNRAVVGLGLELGLEGPTASQHDTSALELQISDLTTQLHSLQESLALEKQSTHQHVESSLAVETELARVKAKLSEEEEKKNKSIQLLRNMKAKILKLEDMRQAKDVEFAAVNAELTELRASATAGTAERDAKVLALTKQVDDMGAVIRKQSDELGQLQKFQEAKNGEIGQHESKMKALKAICDSAVAERDALRVSEVDMKEEVESMRLTLQMKSAQVIELDEHVKDMEYRASMLDDELMTSKRLFESKSVDFEALLVQMSEIEKQFYETEMSVGNNSEEVEQLRREIIQLRREVAGHSKVVREKEGEVNRTRQEREISESLRAKSERLSDSLTIDVERLKAKMVEYESKEEEWKAAINQLELVMSSKELELKSLTDDLDKKLEAKDKIVEECKTRENQLLKLNKSLKDEVRKLARSIGIATPITTPTISHHNSGLDEAEITAANAQFGFFSASRKNSQSSNLDLGGSSSNGLNWGSIGSVGKLSQGYTPVANQVSQQERRTSLTSPTTLNSASRLAANEEYLKNVVLRFVESKRDTKVR